MPQLFTMNCIGRVIALLVAVVGDILINGQPKVTDPQIYKISIRFELGTIIHGPSLLRLFRLKITRYGCMSISVDGHDKLDRIESTRYVASLWMISSTPSAVWMQRIFLSPQFNRLVGHHWISTLRRCLKLSKVNEVTENPQSGLFSAIETHWSSINRLELLCPIFASPIIQPMGF